MNDELKERRQEREYEAKIPLSEEEVAKLKFGDWVKIKEEGEPDAVALIIPNGPVLKDRLIEALVFWAAGNKMMRQALSAEQILVRLGYADEPLGGMLKIPTI